MDEELPPFSIPPADWTQTPESVRLVVLSLMDMVRDLSVQVQELRARVNQTAQNSSKPPSSDPPNGPPPRPMRVSRGKPKGAQPGHADQHRPLLPPDKVDQIVLLHPGRCPRCQTTLQADLSEVASVVRTQVWELPPIRPIVTEYQQQTVCFPACQEWVTRGLPADAPPGAFGPRLTALIGLLHGDYQLSTRQTATFLDAVCGVPISVGSIVTSCGRVSAAIAPVDAAIQATVQRQPHLWVDETTWREGRQRGWLWVAVSPMATCIRIAARRGQAVLRELIGDTYGGIVHSDRAGAYHALPNRQRQVCWAHLVRNLQGLVDYQHAESGWAQRMLTQAHALFRAWHAAQIGFYDPIALQLALRPVRGALRDLLAHGRSRPWRKLQTFCRDLQTHWEALWVFSQVDGIEPTNNRAERAIRPAVLWRKRAFGTQSAGGSRFVERMLSIRATCQQQGRNLWRLLTDALTAAWAGLPAPDLFCVP